MLSKSAFNALLKTLEEPPAHVVFIMATTDAHKVPATILSRAQRFNFKLADENLMFSYLKSIATKEKINISDEAARIIARRGGGSFRDSLSLLDQISTLAEEGSEITADLINSALGLPSDALLAQILAAFTANNLGDLTCALTNLSALGLKPEIVAEELVKIIIKNPAPELLPLLSSLSKVPRSPFPEAALLLALLENAANNPISLGDSTSAPLNIKTVRSGAEEGKPIVDGEQSEEAKEPAANRSPEIDSETSNETACENFDLNTFLEAAKLASPQLFSYLNKSQISAQGEILTIYANNKMSKTMMEKPASQKKIAEAAGNNFVIKIALHSEKLLKDPRVNAISDIMGELQEVKIDGELA
jgi:DNA polymerase-3 subunit gamma/tau